ncbi:hypothetical protein M2360_001871 [Rhizobium sp. SG_E_25_P2]|uniref:hypothetical protein n=1 Tax=Rhizobium sp. SG_E_25_P2 TaxID=2879942 RepID=UPI0024753967|nr:hypothetical protein [Rhizobium sp. SG_E_25_P2]MDH6266475.1 hypothetical protein [Rhizobium sp. SG_E_25_P2]
MHARSLLDYLSDAERAQRGGRRDARDWAAILERLEELELRLGDLRGAPQPREASATRDVNERQALRDEISSILRRRGVVPEPRRANPPPPLAPRDWVEPPPLVPISAFQPPAERADPNLLKFIEAVRLLGRAADRYMSDIGAEGRDESALGPARSPESPSYSTPSPTASAKPPAERLRIEPTSGYTNADLIRLLEEVEELRRTLAQLSPRRNSC